MSTAQPRRTQAERRARSRNALLEAAARGIARYGYARLSLEEVSREAGYSRGALYHQFAGKEALALAVVEWVDETWEADVGCVLSEGDDAAETLLALARRHAIFCRREVASVLQVLRIEFNEQDHPVAHALTETIGRTTAQCVRLIKVGRRKDSIPSGPPASDTADAFLGTLEAVGIEVGGRVPHDVDLAERTARGVLGLPPR